MKLLVLAGSQPRHQFVVSRLAQRFKDVYVILMKRENMIPSPPADVTSRDRRLFEHHFSIRNETEARYFGVMRTDESLRDVADVILEPEQLNDAATAQLISKIEADACVVFGTDLIKDPVLSSLPRLTFNVHLGLSPWYRGSATLFWPFYFMEPQYAGATIHKLVSAVDHGDVAFQVSPTLDLGMGIHDVGTSTVVSLCVPLENMFDLVSQGRPLRLIQQRSTGRIFRVRDFRPAHLRVNYEIFEDRMVDAYLSGDLGGKLPSLVSLTHE